MRKEYKWADVAHHYLLSKIEMRDVGRFNHPTEYFTPSIPQSPKLEDLTLLDRGDIQLKPILRHIEDLVPYPFDREPSDEEHDTADRIWQELWDVVFPESTQDKDADVFESTMGGMWKLRRGNEMLLLNEFGEMYAMDFNGPKEVNGSAVTHVLTREGFDVFGLIKSRQAIRKPIPKP